jgi:hypothetical protein
MTPLRTSTEKKKTLYNRRHDILRALGVTPKLCVPACSHPLRFAEALVIAGGNPADYPEECMIVLGGRGNAESIEAPVVRRRYAKLRDMGAEAEVACKAARNSVTFHQLRAELEAQAAE